MQKDLNPSTLNISINNPKNFILKENKLLEQIAQYRDAMKLLIEFAIGEKKLKRQSKLLIRPRTIQDDLRLLKVLRDLRIRIHSLEQQLSK